MGGVIIDSGRAVLRYKGPISGFVKILNVLEAVPKNKGSVMIETVPLPERPAVMAVEIQVNGISLSEFGETITKLEMAYEKLKELGLLRPPLPEWTIKTRVE